jgi:hypothetical protein
MTRKFQQSFIMWGLFLLLLSIGQQVSAQSIRLDLRETDLAKVVAALQQQAPSVNFSFSQEALEKVSLDRIELKAGRLQDALEILQKKYGLHYLTDGKTVTLKYVPVAPPVTAPMAERRKIEGTVADDNGQPVVGATVHVKGTSLSTVTDVNGHYVIAGYAGKGQLYDGRQDA